MFFISYQRDDKSIYIVDILKRELENKIIGIEVFLDLSTIRPGANWEEILKEKLSKTSILILVLHKEFKYDKLNDRLNWTRLEVEYCLKNGIHIMPVLFGTLEVNLLDKFPESLKAVKKTQVLRIPDIEFIPTYFVHSILSAFPARIEVVREIGKKEQYSSVFLHEFSIYVNDGLIYKDGYSLNSQNQENENFTKEIILPIGSKKISVKTSIGNYVDGSRARMRYFSYKEGECILVLLPRKYLINWRTKPNSNKGSWLQRWWSKTTEEKLEIIISESL